MGAYRGSIARSRAGGLGWGLAAALAFSGGCGSLPLRATEHGDPGVWGGALRSMLTDPATVVPAAAMAVAIPFLASGDHDRDLLEDVSGDSNSLDGLIADDLSEDVTAILVAAPVVLSAWRGLSVRDRPGDGLRAAEVTGESFGASQLLVEGIKRSVGRDRPDGGSGDRSFPSGHASLAFTGATLLARMPARAADGSWVPPSRWWNLAYLPASFAAYLRVEERRHFPSDVVGGALVGFLTTDLLVRVHTGSKAHPGIFQDSGPRLTVLPSGPRGLPGISIAIAW